jgi:hypothetical protein
MQGALLNGMHVRKNDVRSSSDQSRQIPPLSVLVLTDHSFQERTAPGAYYQRSDRSAHLDNCV